MAAPAQNEALYLEIIRYALWVIGVVTTLGIGETLRRLIRMEKKQDEQVETHSKCRESLMRREDFYKWVDNWKPGRDELWKAVNHHKHDAAGTVTKRVRLNDAGDGLIYEAV